MYDRIKSDTTNENYHCMKMILLDADTEIQKYETDEFKLISFEVLLFFLCSCIYSHVLFFII